MTELIRLGLGLVKIAIHAATNDQKLLVVDDQGKPIKEIVLPE